MSLCENCNNKEAAQGHTLCIWCYGGEKLNEIIALKNHIKERDRYYKRVEGTLNLHKARIKDLEEKLSLYEWKDVPDDHLFPTGRYLIEIVDEDGPLVHLMEVEQSFTAIGGCLSFDMPGKRTRYMALPTPPLTELTNTGGELMETKRVPGARILNGLKGLKCDCFTNHSVSMICKDCLEVSRAQMDKALSFYKPTNSNKEGE